MQSDRNIYDAYINDSDLIGTHFRYGKVVPISDMIKGDGKDATLPTLDLADFIAGRILNLLGISHALFPVWKGA